MYRLADEMSSKRELKKIMNQSWFRRLKGGTSVRLEMDLPWASRLKNEPSPNQRGEQKSEEELTKKYWENKEKEPRKQDPVTRNEADTPPDRYPNTRELQEQQKQPGDSLTKVVETVIFVPHMVGSALRDRLQK